MTKSCIENLSASWPNLDRNRIKLLFFAILHLLLDAQNQARCLQRSKFCVEIQAYVTTLTNCNMVDEVQKQLDQPFNHINDDDALLFNVLAYHTMSVEQILEMQKLTRDSKLSRNLYCKIMLQRFRNNVDAMDIADGECLFTNLNAVKNLKTFPGHSLEWNPKLEYTAKSQVYRKLLNGGIQI